MASSSSDGFAIPQGILRHFDLSSSPWSSDLVKSIADRRGTYPDGQLFFDRLLAFAEIDGPSLYPPSTPEDLRRLLHAIHSSPVDRLKQDCFIYYLLRDCDASTSTPQANGHAETMDVEDMPASQMGRAETFARRRCMPRTWRVFMDAYWSLDHDEWEKAVDALTDPSISSLNFISEILLTLATLVSPPSRSLSLIHTFLTLSPRTLDAPLDQSIHFLSLASAASLSSAFTYLRSFADPSARSHMLTSLLCWTLGSPTIPCGSGPHAMQRSTLRELLHLPLVPEESAQLVDFLSRPPKHVDAKALSVLHDLVNLRMIHQGQYAESLQLDRDLAGTGGDEGERQRRREVVREFIAILPEAQRRALRLPDESDAAEPRDTPMVNGHAQGTEALASGLWLNVDGRGNSTPGGLAAPKPSNPLLNLARTSPLPASPKPSPFSGPPRFAGSPASGIGSPRRIVSSSPFIPPTNSLAGPSKTPTPKPRMIINDDAAPVNGGGPARRSHRAGRKSLLSQQVDEAASSILEDEDMGTEAGDEGIEDQDKENRPPSPPPAQAPQLIHNDEPAPRPSSPRRSKRVVSGASTAPKDASPPPRAPPPTSPAAKTRRSTRQTSAAPASTMERVSSMPGAFSPPPRPTTKPRGALARAGSAAPPPTPGRVGRMTRSASRPVMDEPTPKRAKRDTRRMREGTAASEADGAGGGGGVRRSMRRAGTAGLSERGGSPTPSAASESGGGRSGRRSKAMTEGAATPRMTRSRRG